MSRETPHVTCLGCGLTCDDITVVDTDGVITEARSACALGVRWFGDGRVPARARIGDQDATIDAALERAAAIVRGAPRLLVFCATDVAGDTIAATVALADVRRALLDSVTGTDAGAGVLAGQERGRATATFGELRNRADRLCFWGVDPAVHAPRFQSRIAPDPDGLYLAGGRRARHVIAVDIGDATGPADADERVRFTADEAIPALALTRAAVLGHTVDGSPLADRAAALARTLVAARYLAIVADGETGPARAIQGDARDAQDEGLLALAESLNGPTRCALTTFRAGGNRAGIDAVCTWQTGYPMTIDFARGVPRYVPYDGAERRLARHEIDAVLVVGSAAGVPERIRRLIGAAPTVIVGPRASDSPFAAAVAIDTGIAGIHDGGSVVRADDIPLPLTAPLAGRVPATVTTVRALLERVATS